MSLLSRILGGRPPALSEICLTIPCEADGPLSTEVLGPSMRVCVTDLPGLTANQVRAVLACAGKSPVLFLTPGLERSGLECLRGGKGAALRLAADDPGLLRDQVEAIAISTGSQALVRELGIGVTAVQGQAKSAGGILLPSFSWDDLRQEELGRAEQPRFESGRLHLTVPKHGLEPVRAHVAMLEGRVRAAETKAEWERARSALAVFGREADPRPGLPAIPDAPEGSVVLSSGLASQYLITDPMSSRALLDDARLLLLGIKATRLQAFLPVLEWASKGVPIVLVAPGFSDEVLATLVVNKLRGVLSVAAIELSEPQEALEMLSQRTRTPVVHRESEVAATLERAPRVRAAIGLAHAVITRR